MQAVLAENIKKIYESDSNFSIVVTPTVLYSTDDVRSILTDERNCKFRFVALFREALLKWTAQYSRPPCTNLFISAAFEYENIVNFFTEQAYSMRRSIVLSLPLRGPSLPWFIP